MKDFYSLRYGFFYTKEQIDFFNSINNNPQYQNINLNKTLMLPTTKVNVCKTLIINSPKKEIIDAEFMEEIDSGWESL